MRKTIYISERRNKEVADFIKSIPPKEISYEAVKLMEDGMKWRGMGKHEDKGILVQGNRGEVLFRQVPLPDVEEKKEGIKADFSGIKLQRKKLEKGDLEKKFDSL